MPLTQGTWTFQINESTIGGSVHYMSIHYSGTALSIEEAPPKGTTASDTTYTIIADQPTGFISQLTENICHVSFQTANTGFVFGGSNTIYRIYIATPVTQGSQMEWHLRSYASESDMVSNTAVWEFGQNTGGVLYSDGNPPTAFGNVTDGFLQLIPINSLNFQGITTYNSDNNNANANICFVAGTPVNTDQGAIPIEQLDHKTNTINGQPIVAISKITSTDSHLIFLKANCLGPNQPSQDTTVSQLHKILYNGKMTAAQNLPNSNKIPYDGQPLYNVLLENYSKMTVNNLTVETLNPRSNIAILYKFITTNNIDTVGKNKLIALLNQKLEHTNNMRKAFFSNIMTMIMLNILLEPEQKKQSAEVTPYTVLKAFTPQADIVPKDSIRAIF